MKILHLIPTLNKGGAERLTLDICAQLGKKQDIVVKLITFRSDNSYSFLSETQDWEVINSKVISSISGKTTVDVAKLQERIDSFHPDIIHSHLFETEMILAHCTIPPKTKRIVHFHDNMHQFRNFRLQTLLNKTFFTEYFEKRIVLKSYLENTFAIGISKDTFHYCKSVLPKKIKIELLHNAIDLTLFRKKTKEEFSNEITLIGSLVENKGHELAFNTIKELKKKGVVVKLNCLGEGIERNKLEQLIIDLCLENEVKLLGNIDSPESFLQKSFCYLLTSKSEAFGLTLIEAMACGLPVVCTDGKGNRDLIQEGENGFMVWERNPKLLADKIELLLKNDALRIEMGEKARVFAQGFGIEKYVDQLLEIYNS